MNSRIVRGSCREPVRSEANSHCPPFGQLQASGDDSRRPAGDGMAVVQFPAAGRAARLPASRRELPRAQAHQAPEINQPATQPTISIMRSLSRAPKADTTLMIREIKWKDI